MTKRDRYLAELAKPGATVASVADRFGVSRQAVSQAVHAERAAQARRRSDDRRRAAQGAPPASCSVCRGRGHASHCAGVGDRCSSCGAVNPAARWIDGACPRCGIARRSRKAARRGC